MQLIGVALLSLDLLKYTYVAFYTARRTAASPASLRRP